MALGIVWAPYGKLPNGNWPTPITQSRGGDGTFEPDVGGVDPYWNMRGEAGFFHDTPLGSPVLGWWKRLKAKRALRGLGRGLGAKPTDFEMASAFNYTPVTSSWIYTDQGYLQPPPWLPGYSTLSGPAKGWDDNRGAGGANFYGLREGDVVAPVNPLAPAPATVEDVVATMNAHNDRVFALTLVSTTAVAVSAMITIFRTLKLIHTKGAL